MDPSRNNGLTRRGALATALALAAGGRVDGQPAFTVPPLKRIAPFPVGAALTLDQLGEPIDQALLAANFSQLTPGLEMKMESVLRDDGGLDFAKADAVAAYARTHGLRLHGHNLVWYIYRPPSLLRLAGDRAAFARAYAGYIAAVAGRYRGRVSGWDVVNEPTAEDGNGYRDCLWRQVLGMDYVATALRQARAADPSAILFLNEYNLESLPRKRASFLRLVEDLLKAGAPLGGLGTQMHMRYDQDPAAIAPMMRDLAGFGLPIHVSELDVSTHGGRLDLTSPDRKLAAQARLVGATVEAFMRLPPRQRYAVTTWGARDSDSWLRQASQNGDPNDRPLLFDDAGRPKPAARAFVDAVQGRPA